MASLDRFMTSAGAADAQAEETRSLYVEINGKLRTRRLEPQLKGNTRVCSCLDCKPGEKRVLSSKSFTAF